MFVAYLWNFFFFNDTATTEIYTLSLHDALPISSRLRNGTGFMPFASRVNRYRLTSRGLGLSSSASLAGPCAYGLRSEEHTSELQSHLNLVCRLLLEKKKRQKPRLRTMSKRVSTT